MPPNDIRIRASVKDDASRPIKDIHDAVTRLQKRGAEGLITGAAAGATFAAFGLIQSGVAAVTNALGDSVNAAIEEEKSVRRLDAALRANVAGWDGNTAAVERTLAARMRLGFADDEQRASLALLVAATNDVNQALNLQRTAMDLAALKGISLADASQALIRVEGGQYRLLKSLGIELADNATRTDALAAVQRAAEGQAEALANTTGGKLAAAQIRVGESMEKLGTAILPAVAAAAEGVAGAFELAGDIIGTFGDIVGGAADLVGDFAGGLVDLANVETEETASTQAYNLALIELQDQFANGQIGAEEYRAKSEELNAAWQNGTFVLPTVATGIDNATVAMWSARDAADGATIGVDYLHDSSISATDALYTYGASLAYASAQAWALASAATAAGNAQATVDLARSVGGGVGGAGGASTGGERSARGRITPIDRDGKAFRVRTTTRGGGGGGGGAGAADRAEQERREAMVREEKAALSEMEKAGNEYYDAVHERNERIIDDAHRVAQARIKAAHDAANKQIEADHKAATKAIEEAHRAAREEISAARKAVDSKLAEQRRLNASGVTAAEQAQAAIENQRRERDLKESLAAAEASGDPAQIRAAQEAMQSFRAQMDIESMRVAQQAADEAAEKQAALAQAALDAEEAAADKTFEEQQAAEDATYEGRKAAEEATYQGRMAAEEATYQQRKKDEDARWKLVKDKFQANVEALEDSKEINTKLAQVELLRFLQEQRRIAVAEDASKFTIQNIDRQIADAMAGIPKHAGGLGYVPRDDYLAFLHRGEMVVPEGPANALRNGAGSGQFLTLASGAIQINGAGQNANEIARQVIHALERRMTQQGTSSLVRR